MQICTAHGRSIPAAIELSEVPSLSSADNELLMPHWYDGIPL